MLTLTINGQKCTCPACWEELSTEVYQRIILEWDPDEPNLAKRDYFKLFSILTGTSFKAFKATPSNEQTIWRAIKWFVEQEVKFHVKPAEVLDIGGQRIGEIPKKIDHLSIGQMIVIKQTITGVAPESVIAKVVAVVMQPIIQGGDFNPDKVEEVEKEILKLPITLTAPIGFFSVRRALDYGKTRSNVLKRILNNLAQMFAGMWQKWPRLRDFGSLTTSP